MLIHPTDEDLSVGTPTNHPTDEDLSVGTQKRQFSVVIPNREASVSR